MFSVPRNTIVNLKIVRLRKLSLFSIQACEAFINTNWVTNAAKNTNKSSELVARYCDFLLKKSSKIMEDEELDDILTNIVCFRQPGRSGLKLQIACNLFISLASLTIGCCLILDDSLQVHRS